MEERTQGKKKKNKKKKVRCTPIKIQLWLSYCARNGRAIYSLLAPCFFPAMYRRGDTEVECRRHAEKCRKRNKAVEEETRCEGHCVNGMNV